MRNAALVAFGLLVSLASVTDSSAAGDAAIGKTKFYSCAGCHGIAGYKNVYPTYSVPKISGQSQTYLVTALKAYKSGERSHKTMRAQAEGLSEQDIQNLAAYLSQSK
jgi:cytochrome c553